MVVATEQRVTPSQYLELEEKAEWKSELIEGEIVAMAGATANHNRIVLNFCRLFPLENLEGQYEIFTSDMRLWLSEFGSYTYPDVMAIAGEPKFTDSKQTALTNPCLIVEVLSGSTEGYDKTAKFRLYRSIPEFEEYVLVDQEACRVEQFTKVDRNQWLLTELMGEDATLGLKSVGVEIELKDLYKRVSFASLARSDSSEDLTAES